VECKKAGAGRRKDGRGDEGRMTDGGRKGRVFRVRYHIQETRKKNPLRRTSLRFTERRSRKKLFFILRLSSSLVLSYYSIIEHSATIHMLGGRSRGENFCVRIVFTKQATLLIHIFVLTEVTQHQFRWSTIVLDLSSPCVPPWQPLRVATTWICQAISSGRCFDMARSLEYYLRP
jgi:hypothetical protein